MFFNDIFGFFKGIKQTGTNEEEYKKLLDIFDVNYGSKEEAERWIEKLFSMAQEAFDTYNGVEKAPKRPEKLTGELKEQRSKNQSKAYRIFKEAMSKKAITGRCIPSIIRYNDKQIDRGIQNILAPDISKMSINEMEAFNDKFIKMTGAQKKDYLMNNLHEMEDFMRDLSGAATDEEFLSVVNGKAHLLFAIGELQYSDNFNSDLFPNNFGFTLSEEEVKYWKAISAMGVDFASYANRLATIADPLYAIYKDKKAFDDLSEWIERNGDNVEKFVGENGNSDLKIFPVLEASVNTPEKIEKYKKATGGKTINSLYGYVTGQGFGNEVFSKGRLDTNLKILIDKIGIADLHIFDTQGNELTKFDEHGNPDFKDVVNLLYDNKPVEIYDGTRFMQCAKKESEFDNLTHPIRNRMIDFEHKSAQEIKEYFTELKETLAKGQPWYMKVRDALFSSNYGKIIDSIDNLLKKNLHDPKAVREGIIDVYNKANTYINGKITDGKEKTDVTIIREKCALQIYDILKRGMASYDFSKYIENMKTEKEEVGNQLHFEGVPGLEKDSEDIVFEGLPEQKQEEVDFTLDGLGTVEHIEVEENLLEFPQDNNGEIELEDRSQAINDNERLP